MAVGGALLTVHASDPPDGAGLPSARGAGTTGWCSAFHGSRLPIVRPSDPLGSGVGGPSFSRLGVLVPLGLMSENVASAERTFSRHVLGTLENVGWGIISLLNSHSLYLQVKVELFSMDLLPDFILFEALMRIMGC